MDILLDRDFINVFTLYRKLQVFGSCLYVFPLRWLPNPSVSGRNLLCITFLFEPTLIDAYSVPFWGSVFTILLILFDFPFTSERSFCHLASCRDPKKSFAPTLFSFRVHCPFSFEGASLVLPEILLLSSRHIFRPLEVEWL